MSERALETKVGFFLLIGLTIMSAMVIVFGGLQEGFKPSYVVSVKFDNAEGLIKGTTVTLAGSPIGRINDYPQAILDNGLTKIKVDIRINKDIQIRRNARFRIIDVGILGNKGIDVLPRRLSSNPADNPPFLVDGDMIEGESGGGGLSDMAGSVTDLGSSAKPAINQIHELAASLTKLSNRLNSEVMTPETVSDAQDSIKKLKSILTRVDAILASVQQGKGLIGRLLYDSKLGDNVAAFIYNLRHKGIFFYSDVAAQDQQEKGKAKQ